MSLERKPAGRPAPDDPAARTLKPSLNPAQRLQELLRREAQQAREAHPAPAPAAAEEAPPPSLPPFLDKLEPMGELGPAAAPDPPPPAAPAPAAPEPQEPVTLVVLVNSERSTPVEYPSLAEMPTLEALQETHQAFLFSDEWQRRGTALIRTVRLRRRRR